MSTVIEIEACDQDCIRLLQITDTHIFADANARFDGIDTGATLESVIQHVRQQVHQPDAVIVTGDLVHDPCELAYARLLRYLADLALPTFCLPGNHDDPVLMHQVLNQDTVSTHKAIRAGGWGIILLDTWLAGTHAGRLAPSELDFLERQLGEFAQRPVLLCLHHPPVSVASPWMDAMMLQNPEELFAVLDRHSHVRGLVWGHIHQSFMTGRGDLALSASPSTCVQFTPGSTSYRKDTKPPGYNLIRLHGDGRLDISVQRI